VARPEPGPGEAGPERFGLDALVDLPPELLLSRLPPGRHGLPRSFVADNQRARLVAAMLRVLPRHGYPATTIGHVTEEAGVSRAAFYRQFASKEECFLAAYDLAGEWLREHVAEAVGAGGEWSVRVRAGVSAALGLLAEHPPLARLFAVEALQAGQAARERQRACLGGFAAALRAGRPSGAELPAELEEMLLGGAIATIGRYVDAGRSAQLPEAAAELVQYLLIPYLEPEQTRQIAAEAS
jgi:AcrR family transcriptional regulator